MAIRLDGKALAEELRKEIREEIENLGIKPGLAVIIIGESPAARIYVESKKKDCAAYGLESAEFSLPEDTTEDTLLNLITELNQRPDIHGILIQLPLPEGFSKDKIINAISPEKDVDAFHPSNIGRVMTGDYSFLPCTPAGVMELLAHYEIGLVGQHVVMVGCSNIVGKPQALLMLNKDATVTICHSFTRDLGSMTRQADILVVAAGQKGLITKDMVKPGAVVVDIGINRGEDGKIYGDVDFPEVEPIASYITPVPGGVGPMTRAVLMRNTLTAAKRLSGLE